MVMANSVDETVVPEDENQKCASCFYMQPSGDNENIRDPKSKALNPRNLAKAMTIGLAILLGLTYLKVWAHAQPLQIVFDASSITRRNDSATPLLPAPEFYTKVGANFKIAQVEPLSQIPFPEWPIPGLTGDEEPLSHPANEIFAVSDTDVVKPSYGPALYTTTLMNHTFANSWGSAFVGNLTPPPVKFNKVVVTLYTTVNYVQYDRLAHLYVGEHEVWRTSTIEPGNRVVFSNFSQDLSDYARLFESDNQFIFQLDNIVTPDLKGAFECVLSVSYYYQSNLENEFEGHYNIFNTNKPADSFYPLIKADPRKPAVVTIEDTLDLPLPTVPVNTTRLTLRIFSSGNGIEEFWYTDVVDENAPPNQPDYPASGPIRILNVLFNGEKIATAAPEPILFTGGINPYLWNPIVCTDAFSLPHYDFDLTGLLPYLWTGTNLTGNLQFQISNGLGEVLGNKTSVQNGWITTASFLGYESGHVIAAKGSEISSSRDKSGHQYAPSIATQIVTAFFSASLQNELSFTLKNNFTIHTSTSLSTVAGTFNSQNTIGNFSYVAHYGESFSSSSLQDSRFQKQIYELNSSFQYPLVLVEYQTNMSSPLPDMIELDHIKGTSVEKNGQVVFELLAGQSGSVIRENIRNAQGSANLTVAINSGSDCSTYERQAVTNHSAVLSDEITRSGFATIDYDSGPTITNYGNFWLQVVSQFTPGDSQLQIAKDYFNQFTTWQ